MIYWKPNGGSWTNTGPSGFGELYDSTNCIIKKGFFNGFKLTDPNGQLIDYSNKCTVYEGEFKDDVKHGEFDVYEIEQALWEQAIGVGGNGVAAANKKRVTFNANVPTVELPANAIQVRIDSNRGGNGHFTNFNVTK